MAEAQNPSGRGTKEAIVAGCQVGIRLGGTETQPEMENWFDRIEKLPQRRGGADLIWTVPAR